MAVNPFDNPEFGMMYQDALYSLYAGAVMPHDREILAMAPLPTDVVDPFASQDVDPRQIMGFAYNSLVTWIDEAKKANYFSKRFTDLSKLVMKGVMTMGRGLVTLHNRGEDLSQAPMQIGELISVSSYHFRKSYLGVIQTAKSHPEISERLLINQLSWTNLLLRLYKTRDKLNSECGRRNAESLSNSEGGMRNAEALPDTQSALNHGHALPDVAALFEPAALAAPRALSSLDGSKSPTVSRRHTLGNSNAECGIRKAELSFVNSEDRISESENKAPETESTDKVKVPEALIEKAEGSNPERGTANGQPEEKLSEAETQRTTKNPENQTEKTVESGLERGTPHDLKTSDGQSEKIVKETERPEQVKTPHSFPGPDPSTGVSDVETGTDPGGEKLIHETWQPANDPPELSPGRMDRPFYLEILHHAFARSAGNEDDKIIFTTDEICYLANDPAFAEIYPDQAADMRRILAEIG